MVCVIVAQRPKAEQRGGFLMLYVYLADGAAFVFQCGDWYDGAAYVSGFTNLTENVVLA